jgi:hypothetical protein
MKAFLSAVIVALALGVGASMILERNQVTTEAKFSSSAVRN